MDALDALFSRRSVRKMTAEMPEKELIEKVIEAGRVAPSGGNSQTTHFIVITKPEVLAELRELVQSEFAKMEAGPDTYASMRNSIRASKKGNYVYDYGAPLMIVTANKKGYGNALADSACALENMMIAAHALGLGSCWINQLHWLTDQKAVQSYMAGLGLKEDETITGGLILGYAAEGVPMKRLEKKNGNPVTWI